MSDRPFAQSDPFLKIIVLFLLSFLGVTVFMLMGSGLIKVLYGVNFITNQEIITDYSDPNMVNVNRILLLFQHLGMFIVPAMVFGMLVSTEWPKRLGFYKPRPVLVVAAVVMILFALPTINILAWLNEQMVFPEFLGGLEQVFAGMEDSASRLTKALTEQTSPIILIANIFTIALIPALGEEMVFRGALIPILKKWTKSVHWGVWISAILFSAMHLQFYGFLPRMLLGAALGYLFVWSGSLWVPVLAHFANNALALILIFFMTRGDITADIDEFNPTASDYVWVVVSIAVVTSTLYYIYKNRVSTQAEIVHPESE